MLFSLDIIIIMGSCAFFIVNGGFKLLNKV